MRFQMALLVAHRQIHNRYFAADPMVNRTLGFHLHGYRQVGDWRIILALTPWMLSRLWFASTPPDIEIPDGWRAEQRADADYQLLGPAIDLPEKLGGSKAHLNYHPTLGHYLLQPIALNMEHYGSAREVFEDWNHVIQVRDEALKQLEKECGWQREISRRELFTRHLS
jgi:hypothetical protein